MQEMEKRERFKVEPWLGGIALLLLLIGCVAVLKPFLSSLMWAVILAYSLYPLQRRFTLWFRGSRTLAACFVTLTLTLTLAGPVLLIGLRLVEDGRTFATATKDWFLSAPQKTPEWIVDLPIIGEEITAYWTEFSNDRNRWMEDLEKASAAGRHGEPDDKLAGKSRDVPPIPDADADALAGAEAENAKEMSEKLVALLGRTLGVAQKALVTAGLAVGQGVTQVILSAFLAFFFLRNETALSERLKVGVERLAGARGKHLLKIAGDTVRGVVYGILGTALIQSVIAVIGLTIAGVPGAVILGVVTFFLAVILPFGPPIVWIPATLWLFAQGQPGWGIFMALWGLLAISSVDNVVRPLIISQETKMPFVLIFCGVIGGALAFGLVGLFLGPTMLAVAYRLIDEWSAKPALATTPAIGETQG
jgi:predicted PurR-regulated permease PerM